MLFLDFDHLETRCRRSFGVQKSKEYDLHHLLVAAPLWSDRVGLLCLEREERTDVERTALIYHLRALLLEHCHGVGAAQTGGDGLPVFADEDDPRLPARSGC